VNAIATTGANSNFYSGVLFVDSTNSRVGVGTTSPGTKLDVVGTFRQATGNSSFASTLYVDDTNDRVGIGTASPNAKLQVDGTVNATAFSVGGSTVWNAANDGSGSGLDADLLD